MPSSPAEPPTSREDAPKRGGVLQFARSVLFDLWFYFLMAAMGLLCAPLAIYSRDGAYWSCKTFCRISLWSLRRICGVSVELRGEPPEGAVLIAAKHQSFLDILVATAVLPRATFVMKRSLIYAPVLGFYALRLGVAPVRRGAGGGAALKMREQLRGLGRSEGETPRQIIIYPQGTRLPPGAVAPYRPGVALLYADEPEGCVPVATNSGMFWGRRSILKRPGVAVVSFLQPIPPGLKRAEFMELVEQRIETASDALMAEAQDGCRREGARAEG